MKTIRFVPQLDDEEKMLLKPISAKKLVPDWYKDGEFYYIGPDGKENPGLKTCKPFIDVMIAGYFLLIPFDIYVGKDENGELTLKWDGPDEWSGFIAERPAALGATIPVPAGHRKNHLVWASKWGWKTPRGYSSIITHPFNASDLPFRTMSGLIDSDAFFPNGNIPFHIQDNFSGVIKSGTPFAQIIPIKRESWNSFSDFGLWGPAILKSHNLDADGNAYKNVDWKKKEYN